MNGLDKEIAELHIQLDGYHERLDEADAEVSAQVSSSGSKIASA